MTNFFLSGGGITIFQSEIRAIINDLFNNKRINTMLLDFAQHDYRNQSESNILMTHSYLTSLLGKDVDICFIRNSYDAYRVPRDILLKEVDVLIVPGGDGDLIKEQMIHFYGDYNWKELFQRKNMLVIGSSAGTNIWSTHYYSNDNQKCQDGLGTLNIKTFCHFDITKMTKLKELIEYGNEDLMTLPINENSYVYLGDYYL